MLGGTPERCFHLSMSACAWGWISRWIGSDQHCNELNQQVQQAGDRTGALSGKQSGRCCGSAGSERSGTANLLLKLQMQQAYNLGHLLC
jgi:hypothetical protein